MLFCTIALRNFQVCSSSVRKDDTDLNSEANDKYSYANSEAFEKSGSRV